MSNVTGRGSAGEGAEQPLSPEHLRRIAQAITGAEQKTGAEIRVVISRAPTIQHPFFSLMWSALAALLLPWAIIFIWPLTALATLEVQAIIFMVCAGILMMPRFSERVVPKLALKAAVRSAAIEKFLTYGMVETVGRTGVLIYVAANEHMVEVVADEGIHHRLGAGAWAEICGIVASGARRENLTDGLIAGVERAGDLLGDVLPRKPGDQNQIDDRVIVL